jgi:16S rRNA C967 or C1407 C5-methylase (RsmB/RsmF family)/NOL1/NOP2/fmu family ribosome biogenesis protein
LITALPQKLIAALNKLDHFDEAAFRALHESGEQVISVRFNAEKIKVKEGSWPASIPEPSFPLAERIPWSSYGYYLSERPSFTLDPLFHAGAYYVQEASGMFLEQALRSSVDLSKPLKVLDLCAAPGGKSTLIQGLISKESLLVSNEVIKTRVPVLHQNLSKWGLMNGILSSNDPKDFKGLPGFFDVLLVDAPCSGSGLFRKDPEAISEWSEDGVKLCNQRQQRILADAWDCLKENGILIYSTCSYSSEENEDIMDTLLKKLECTSLRLPLEASWNITETRSEKAGGYGYRFYPDKLNGEGFFLSVVQKKTGTPRFPKAVEKREGLSKREEAYLRKYLPDERLQFIRINEWVHSMPANLINDLLVMKNYLYLKKAGILTGKMGSDEWIPDHELALSTGLNPLIPELELSRSDALKYLRRDDFTVDAQAKGWKPVSYQHQKLGWVKMLSNRINNYFPKSWRILK